MTMERASSASESVGVRLQRTEENGKLGKLNVLATWWSATTSSYLRGKKPITTGAISRS